MTEGDGAGNLYRSASYGEAIRPVPHDYVDAIRRELNPQPGKVLFEIGVNKGDLEHALADTGATIVGMDINEPVLRNAQTEGTFVADARKPLPLPDASVDGVFSSHVLEHLTAGNTRDLFGELARITKPGGKAFHAFPFAPIRGVDGALADALGQTRNPIKALKMARQLHIQNLTPNKLAKIVEGTGWELDHGEIKMVWDERGPSCFATFNRVEADK